MVNSRRLRHVARAAPLLLLSACASSKGIGGASGAGSAGHDGVGSESGSGATTTSGGGGLLPIGQGNVTIESDTGAATPSSTPSVDSGRPQHCDDAGRCSCVNIASLGQPGRSGGSTTALMDWLNTESSAAVSLITQKPTIDAAFLAPYDVILLQSMDGWMFAPSEIAALATWVKAGGGLIAMSGYTTDPNEVMPLNQLLSFSDISYNGDDVEVNCPPALNGACYCWGGTIPVGGWTPGPIGQNLTSIGAFRGRSINPGTAVVDARDGTTVLAAHESVGLGHIFAWCDEWVTYTGQWLGVTAGANTQCAGMTASDVFQVPQFWYNAIGYASSATQCKFTINNPMIIPR